ncbi:MAG: glycosyltransferase [Tepidisphaeraceae bacterium]
MAINPRDLTIVIPAYRCARFLPATVRSALRCGEMPILIVEDHAPDDTLETAQALAKQNPGRITVVAQPKNLGTTRNWQSALEQVRTPLTLKLDDDDIIDPPYVQAAMEFLEEHPKVGIVAGADHDIPEDFGVGEDLANSDFPVTDSPVTAADFREYSGVDAAELVLRADPYPGSSSTIYRMSTWREVGGFDANLGWCADREIWFRVALHASIAQTKREVVFHRMHPIGVTGNFRRGDRFCYEWSYMYRKTRRAWPQRELTPLFRRHMAVNSKAFFGSCRRAARAGRFKEIIPRALAGFRDAAWALSV